jgi:UDP-galactopyranose mutase
MPNQPDLFDVIIIGSGAGGAPIAHTLVNAGKSVLLSRRGRCIARRPMIHSG